MRTTPADHSRTSAARTAAAPHRATDRTWSISHSRANAWQLGPSESVMLHGGSANGNLFLGVVLGNNMNWKEYDIHLWDEYAPRFVPDWIVVAPDGFGQVMWRFMGEQDVLDVIADVQRHYHVDPDRIALGGLSNGGVGAYNLGLRHASMFSTVMYCSVNTS